VLDADATRIEQVLANLLNNAAKFTEPGGDLGLSVETRDGEAVLTVRDNGQGIAPDLLPRIFDLFVQEDRSLARSHGGLGIGLTLVRSLVERHGGKVEARSEGPGRGSEIVVRLPLLGPARAEAPEKPGLPRAAAEPGPARVLLVEDNVDAADALAELLRMWGHEVEVVHDGASAVAKAGEARPDVVLLDIGLPGMDGYQVAGALRALPDLQGALLVALTGYGQEADRRRSAAAGFDHHLVKPVDLDELKRLVATARNIGRGDAMLLRGTKSHHQASDLHKTGGNPGPAPRTKERDDELVRR
jgi:CheY-like chemotaxis protein